MCTKKIFDYGLRAVMIVLAFTALSFTGCENPAGSEFKNLAGNVSITPNTGVTTGMELTANYSGSEDVTYQWNKGDAAIDGATANKYTPTEAGSYTVTVSAKGYNPKTSAAVEVTVTSAAFLTLGGNITITPNENVNIGTELTAAYSGTEPVTYQWNKDGVAIDGATESAYTPTEAGSYTVTISAAGYNSKTSAGVEVNDPNLPILGGSITITPNEYVTTGMELTANYNGSEDVSYKWKKGGADVGTNSNKFTPTEEGSYTVTVSASGYNSKTSDPVTVSLPDLSGDISITPNTGVTIGTELTANYNGSETVSYQWEKDGENVGTNSNKCTANDPGSYTVTVSASGYNSKISDPVTVAALTPIANAEIEITAPVKSEEPETTATTDAENFTIGTVTWSPDDNPFKGGVVYTATVTLTAKSGHTFTGLSSSTVNGQDAQAADNTGATVTLSYTFAATDTRTATDLKIKTAPTKLTYTHGETLDLAGLVVTLTFDDSSSDDVAAADFASRNITASPSHGDHLVRSTNNGHPVTIKYGSSHTVDTGNLTVNQKAISAAGITVDPIPAQNYNGSAHTPTVTVKDGSTTLELTTDYTVGGYTNNTSAGTASVTITGAGNYSGTRTENFTINARAINATGITVDAIAAQIYNNGNVLTPAVTVKDGATTLAATTHYTVAYTDNTSVGTATVTITGAGNYSGSRTTTFAITRANGAAVPTTAPTRSGTATTSSITLNTVTITASNPGGQTVEYGINTTNTATGATWQDTTTFDNLTIGTTYYFFARSKENATHNAGTPSNGAAIATSKNTGAAVSGAPLASAVTSNSVTLNAVTIPTNPGNQTVEYARSNAGSTTVNASTWQDSTEFTGLTAGAQYSFFARAKTNDTYNAGTNSSGRAYTIAKNTGAAVSGAPTVSGTPTINSITLNTVTLATATGQTVQYGINTANDAVGAVWQDETAFTGLVPSMQYYFFARSKETTGNNSYSAGAASGGTQIATANPSTTYIITGSDPTFTATKGGTTVSGANNQPIQDVINAIQTDANGAAITIQFGATGATTPLDIGTGSVQLNNTNGTWGAIVLAGKITSANPTTTQATVMIGNGVSINSTGDIANTDDRSASGGTGSDRAALRNENTSTGGTVTISGGTVSATSTARAIYNVSGGAVTISGGVVSTTTNWAILTGGNGYRVTISGGRVSSETSTAIYLNEATPSGKVTVSGNAVVTSGSTAIYSYRGSIEITGGTVETTGATSNAVYCSGETITISGGTISAQGGRAVYSYSSNNGVTISGNAVLTSANTSTSSGTIYTEYANSVTITGNSTVSNTANGRAVYRYGGGTTTLGGDPVITGTIFYATTSGGVSISTSAATPFAPSTGRVYTIGYASAPAVDRVAVTNGAPFAANFALSGQALRRLVVSGANLVIGEN